MNSPTLVSDTFHFSHYYWRSWDLSSGGVDGESTTEDATDSASPTSGDEIYKPEPVKAEDIKLKFYAHVMGDGSNNVHFGKWDGIPVDAPDAYGRATVNLTDYMFDLAMSLQPHRVLKENSTSKKGDFAYVDLGSGTGASAVHVIQKHGDVVSSASCLNLCHAQNIAAEDLARQRELSDRISVVEGTFEDAPFPDQAFDLAFSQDAFIHSISKKQTFSEAYRITKPGGAFVFCDLMAGDNPDFSESERVKFTKSNVLNDWLTPAENVRVCEQVGWRDVEWIDLTTDMRLSFELMKKKAHYELEHGNPGSNMNRVLLMNYSRKIQDRLVQIDRGVFKWCVIHARKPVVLDVMCKPPVPFNNTSKLILEEKDLLEDDIKWKQEKSIAVIDILTKMPKERIMALPKSVSLLITMSAGLDHIDVGACHERNIVVKQAGRDAITSHVVQYTLAFLIVGLRDALSQIGVMFPSKGWNLNWNCEGKPLGGSTVAIVGMGIIAKELVSQMRKIAPTARILYHVPEEFRENDAESKYNLEYFSDLKLMASQCDVLCPLCPLTKSTANMINADVIASMKPEAGLLNFARGKVVDTDALTKALETKAIKYAILDTTFPEPLPSDHPLWTMKNCFILPHYATNTKAVRTALVEDIQPIIEEHFGLGYSDAKLRQQERELRHDLAVAHRLTAKLGMDMLVWNHISARFNNGCLITPGRMLWNQIGPNDLVFSSDNVTADIIHDAVYAARPDIQAIIHLHTPNAVAVSCLEDGFIPLTQDAAYFYGKVANYDWDGVSDDASEGPAITQAVRDHPGCNTLLMCNHGFVCFGKSVREAWVLAYYFERACEVQLRVMQTGAKVRMPPPSVMRQAAETSYLPEFAPGVCEWDALCNDVDFGGSEE